MTKIVTSWVKITKWNKRKSIGSISCLNYNMHLFYCSVPNLTNICNILQKNKLHFSTLHKHKNLLENICLSNVIFPRLLSRLHQKSNWNIYILMSLIQVNVGWGRMKMMEAIRNDAKQGSPVLRDLLTCMFSFQP